jgi:hypothetical protein
VVRLILTLFALTGPASAACFGPPMPAEITYDQGRVTILSSTARDVTFRTDGPIGTNGTATLRGGLFLMSVASTGVAMHFDWQDPLPALRDLAPGDQLRLTADMVVEHAARSFHVTDITVLRRDSLTVDGCPYPVLVVDQTDRLNGRVQMRATRWISPDLGLALKVETPGQTMTATAMK